MKVVRKRCASRKQPTRIMRIMDDEIPRPIDMVSSFSTNPSWGGFHWDIIKSSHPFKETRGSILMDCSFSPME